MQIDKPARYIGNEFNSVIKNPADVDIRFAMCFPDVYEIGMSHLGIQILYGMFNDMEDVWCERVYSPWLDLDAAMRREKIPLFALESQDPIKEFDFLGITLQYEMCYTNILQVLDLAQIPLLAKDRGEDCPLVIGGGPGGMQAALEATKRGHEVVLCEASDRLGALRFADNDTWFKRPMKRYRDSQVEKVMRCGADVRLNTRVTKEIVDEVKPDVLIAAVGSEPFAVPVPGHDGPNVVFGAYLTPETKLGEKLVVIGGGFIGCEEAVDLAKKGHDVTILEMIDDLAINCGRMHRIALMHEIETSDKIHPAMGMRCTKIDDKGVYALDKEGNEVFYPADTVIMASGMRSRAAEAEALRPLVKEFYVIGDANKAQKIMNGTRDAYDAVAALGYR